MNCVGLTLPSTTFAPLIGGLMVVDMQPEHTSTTATRSTLDRMRVFPRRRNYPAQLLTAGESEVLAATLPSCFGFSGGLLSPRDSEFHSELFGSGFAGSLCFRQHDLSRGGFGAVSARLEKRAPRLKRGYFSRRERAKGICLLSGCGSAQTTRGKTEISAEKGLGYRCELLFAHKEKAAISDGEGVNCKFFLEPNAANFRRWTIGVGRIKERDALPSRCSVDALKLRAQGSPPYLIDPTLNLRADRFPAVKADRRKPQLARSRGDRKHAVVRPTHNEYRLGERSPLHPQEGAPYFDDYLADAGGSGNPP